MPVDESFWAIDDRRSVYVETPEWAPALPDVKLRTPTSGARDAWELEINRAQKAKRDCPVRASLVQRCAVDAENKLLFARGEINRLATRSSEVVERLFDAAQKLCGVSDKVVEELEKNSGPTTGDGSPTD